MEQRGARWCVTHPVQCGRGIVRDAGQRFRGGGQRAQGSFHGERRSWAGSRQSWDRRVEKAPVIGRGYKQAKQRVREFNDDRAYEKRSRHARDLHMRDQVIARNEELNAARRRGEAKMARQAREIEEYCRDYPSDCKNMKNYKKMEKLYYDNMAKGHLYEQKVRMKEARRAHRAEKYGGALAAPGKFLDFVSDDLAYAGTKRRVPTRMAFAPYRPRAEPAPTYVRRRSASSEFDDLDQQFKESMGF
jgi:hypothetical protein